MILLFSERELRRCILGPGHVFVLPIEVCGYVGIVEGRSKRVYLGLEIRSKDILRDVAGPVPVREAVARMGEGLSEFEMEKICRVYSEGGVPEEVVNKDVHEYCFVKELLGKKREAKEGGKEVAGEGKRGRGSSVGKKSAPGKRRNARSGK
jgi:hypothetical protein